MCCVFFRCFYFSPLFRSILQATGEEEAEVCLFCLLQHTALALDGWNFTLHLEGRRTESHTNECGSNGRSNEVLNISVYFNFFIHLSES